MFTLVSVLNGDVSSLIVNIGVILLVGLIMGRSAEYLKIPSVTGYIIAGLLLGPITGIISAEDLESFGIISHIALGFIAFQVGNELWFGKLKKTGGKIVVITIVQAFLTTLIVAGSLMFFVEVPVALILGGIAAATAPAPIMMIIKKYRTKGELTDTILPVVGLDDAIGVILFGVLLSVSVSIISTSGNGIEVIKLITEPLLEIGISILIGSVVGLLAGFAIRTIDNNRERKEKNLDVIIIAVFLSTGVALLFDASPILAPMIAGTFVTNLINKDSYILEEETIRFFIPPLMILFFTIAGAQLQFDVLITVGMVGFVYIVSRIIGKFAGAYLGAKIVKSEDKIKRYLGLTLLPQSGVAIGLSIAAYSHIKDVNIEYALIIKNVVLASVLFFALVGPILVKYAFWKTNELKSLSKKTHIKY